MTEATTNQPVLMGANNATQALAFFRANGIVGKVIPSRHRRQVLVEYHHMAEFLSGSIGPTASRILAVRENHTLAA